MITIEQREADRKQTQYWITRDWSTDHIGGRKVVVYGHTHTTIKPVHGHMEIVVRMAQDWRERRN